MDMQRFLLVIACTLVTTLPVQAAPCLLVTLTGTMSGPVLLNGVAGAGYGDDSNGCSAMKLQFDAGRGTALRLSQVNVDVGQLDAIFFTHMHSDHTEGFIDVMQRAGIGTPPGQS
jgi:ribonuclease Z